MTKTKISENFDSVQNAISKQAKKFNRAPSDINLVAVSKVQPAQALQDALDTGQRLFGENRVQEAQEHWLEHRKNYPDLKLHLIGSLQTNKASDAVALFDVIETIDRPKLARVIAQEIEKKNKKIECFIQVNVGEEEQKAGVIPADLPALLKECEGYNLTITGLMCIPPFDEAPAPHFALLAKLAKQHKLENLSMGMSSDFEKAIPLGATHIRVGTALFGQRETVKT